MIRLQQLILFCILSAIFLPLVDHGGFAIAQEKTIKSDSTVKVLRATPHFGLVLPHHEEMTYFINDFSYGLDLNFGIKKYNKPWHKYTNYPELGFGIFYNSFGNPSVFGYGISGYGYIQPNIIRNEKWSFSSKISLGIGYVNKPYHEVDNPYNHVFGSNFNVFVGLGCFVEYNIARRWSISSSLAFNHLSNGSIKKPNHGINTITIGLGAGYNLSHFKEPSIKDRFKAPKNNARDLLIFFSAGRSQRSLYKPSYYPAFNLNINHVWWVSKKSAWGLGLDGIYYGAAPYDYFVDNNQFSGDEESFSHVDKMYGGVFGSYNYRFNNTQLFFHIGAYLLYNIKPKQMLYPRLGVRHRVYKNLFANFSIKASFFKAEYIELGLGYRINYKKNEL